MFLGYKYTKYFGSAIKKVKKLLSVLIYFINP